MVSTPKAPDPVATAQAQAGMNRDTAITQQQLNMINQTGPTGSLTYKQTGMGGFKDSNGKWVETPMYTATTKLTKEQQAIFDQSQAAQKNIANIAKDQSKFLKGYLSKPLDLGGEFKFDNKAAEDWAYNLGASRLNPRLKQQEQTVRDRLIAQGIRPGTEAWDREMTNVGQQRNDAYNQLMLTGRQQAYNESLTKWQQNVQDKITTRNQPLNEISALLSGSQIAGYTPGATPQTSVGGVDYTGLVNNKYNADMQASQAKMGGLFGLLAAPFSFMSSDARLKEDIRRVGKTDGGSTIYTFRYIGDPVTYMGVMAQEEAVHNPDAVAVDEHGFLMVNYSKVH